MAGRVRVTLNHPGVAEVLQSTGMHRLVQDAAEKVAANARAAGVKVEGIPGDVALPVEVSVTTTDRAHALVTLAHPSGQAAQAKHGLLTSAAGGAGLEVKSK